MQLLWISYNASKMSLTAEVISGFQSMNNEPQSDNSTQTQPNVSTGSYLAPSVMIIPTYFL